MTRDIEACTAALRMMHEEGFSVNDVARFNALIGGAKMTQIDIEAMRALHKLAQEDRPEDSSGEQLAEWACNQFAFEGVIATGLPAILDELESVQNEVALLRGLLGSCACIPEDAI